MKKILFFLLAGMILPRATSAQLGDQCDVPVNITVIQQGYPNWIRTFGSPITPAMPSNVTADYSIGAISLGSLKETEAGNFPTRLKPGVKYNFVIDNYYGIYANYVIRVPEQFDVYIDGSKSFGQSAAELFTNGTGKLEYEIELRYKNESGKFASIPYGYSPLVRIGDLRWEVSVGALENGMSAGYLRLCDNELSARTFTRSALTYSSPKVNGDDELHVILEDLDTDGVDETIRQIKAPQGLIDVVDTDFDGSDVTGYEVRFYRAGTFNSGAGLYTPTGSTHVTYHIRKTSSNQLTLSQTDGRGTRNSVVTATADGSLYDWTLITSGLGAAQSVTIDNTSLGSGLRKENITINQSGISGAPTEAMASFSFERIYEEFDAELGEVLISEKDNENRTTTYHYYTNASETHRYGQLKAVEKPFGDWDYYDYYDVTTDPTYADDWSFGQQVAQGNGYSLDTQGTYWLGQMMQIHGRIKSHSSPVDGSFSLAPSTYSPGKNAGVYYTEYEWRPVFFALFNGGPFRYLPPQLLSSLTYADQTVVGINDNSVGLAAVQSGAYQGTTQYRFYHYYGGPALSHVLQTYDWRYSDNQGTQFDRIRREKLEVISFSGYTFDYRFNHKPTVEEWVLNDMMVSYGYASVTGYPGVGDGWAEIKIIGTQSTNYSNVTYSHSGEATIDFESFRNLDLVNGKSTKELSIYNGRGELTKTEEWAYTEAGAWALVSRSTYNRNDFGQLLSIMRTSGSGGARTIYEAGWTGLQKDYEIDELGIRTDYTYDGLDRLLTSNRSGSGSVSGIPTSLPVTTYYDALGRKVQELLGSGGDQLTTTQQFDSRGQLLSATDANGFTTAISYSNASGGGVQTTISHPRGTEVRVTRPDGKLKSSTGAAVVDTYYSYTYDGSLNGALVTRTDIGSASSDTYQVTHTDFLGRVFHEESTTAEGSNFERDTVYYHALNKPEFTLETEVAKGSTSGGTTLKSIFEYDDLYHLIRYGIDVNGNDSLDLAGTDRITEQETTFVDNGGLKAKTVSAIYSDSSATPTVLSTTLTTLAGLSSTELSEVVSTDLFGNVTTTTATLNRSASTVTITSDVPESEIDEVQTQVNGFLAASVNARGQTTEFSYNSAGLPTGASLPRGFDTLTTYVPNRLQVESITEGSLGGSGGYTTQYGYDSVGRLNQITDGAGVSSYLDYNTRNQITHQWGNNTSPVEYEYDDLGRLRYQRTYRDAATNWDTPTWPGGGASDTTEFTYHPGSFQIHKRIDAASEETVLTYDQRGRLMTRLTPQGGGITTIYQYDAKTDELLEVDYSDSTPDLAYTWNRMGALASVIEDDGGANPTTRTFNYQTAFIAGSENNLQLLSEDLPNYYPSGFNMLGYTYSASGMTGRPLDAGIGSGTGLDAFKRTTAYQTNGRVSGFIYSPTGASHPAQNWTYEYLADSNLVEDVELTGSSLNHRREYEPDRDLMSSIATRLGTSTDLVKHAYRYDDLGRREDATRSGSIYAIYRQFTEDASGSTLGPAGVITDYSYNDRSHLTGAVSYTGSSETDFVPEHRVPGREHGLSFDAQGNRTSVTRDGQTATWTPNALNQVTTRENPASVDVAGSAAEAATVSVGPSSTDLTNIIRAEKKGNYFHAPLPLDNSTGPVYADDLTIYGVTQSSDLSGPDTIATDTRRAFLPSASESFSYDEDGNLEGEDRWDFTWDAENRLTTVETSAAAISAGAPQEKVAYRYDYLGRRVQRTHSIWNSGTQGYDTENVTTWAYDGFNPIYERVEDGSATLIKETYYAWGLDWSGSEQGAGGVGGLLMIFVQEAGQTAEAFAVGYDGNGNVAVLVNTAGTIVGAYEYDPFGKSLRASGSKADLLSHRFSTKYTDPITHLIDYGLRWYHASLGRFINRDPIGESGGLNLYALVNNNPVNDIDVLGLNSFDYYSGQRDSFTGSSDFDPLEGLQQRAPSGGGTASFSFSSSGFGGESFSFSRSRERGFDGGTQSFRFEASDFRGLSTQPQQQASNFTDDPNFKRVKGATQAVLSPLEALTETDSQSQLSGVLAPVNLLNRLFEAASPGADPEMARQLFRDIRTALSDPETQGALSVSLLPVVRGKLPTRAPSSMPNRFDGVRQASQYLQDMGVARADRVRILQSFEVDAMRVRTAGQSEFGLRFFSNPNRAGGSYLFETFPASRGSLAIKPEWSTMSGFRQFQVRPGATILEGPAATQGALLPGGQTQKFILDWRADLISP